jgi:4-diphosphocytidyl-2-C-methyl-D-erythritol kinase
VITLHSPAKINRYLKVVGLRPDGYHEIETEMETITLFDRLTLAEDHTTSFSCSDSTIPHDSTNLVLKAHAAFQRWLQRPIPVRFHLEKWIPHQAGLGGGSGNAATTLWGLNLLAENPFSIQELMAMGGEVGSDVPFFFSQGWAICRGRGERVEGRACRTAEKVTIVKPPYGCPTADVYRHFSKVKTNQEVNGLEPAAFLVQPQLRELKKALLASGFNQVTLAGSGSSFFCLGEGTVPKGVWSGEFFTVSREPSGWY